MPILATDSLISLPGVPMSVVQSVIPISAALIVVAEVAYLLELWQARDPRELGTAPAATADALH
jgi:TRAP-type C4-dicarboxylate transport system permease small subunit